MTDPIEGLLETLFPNLRSKTYRTASPPDEKYNCIAWAARDSSQWWEPVGVAPYYWPEGLPVGDYSPENYVAAFESLGFERCSDGSMEPGVEKVAVFVDSLGRGSHAARLMADGFWASKLGQWIDIEHEELAGVEGARYGHVVAYLRRPAP